MSMFSTPTSKVAGLASFVTVSRKGYRLTTTMSMGVMPAAEMADMCEASSRMARMPPWTAGWSVLTRPDSISGKPVKASTRVTWRPAASSVDADPPVETSSKPRAARPWVNGERNGMMRLRRRLRKLERSRERAHPLSPSRLLFSLSLPWRGQRPPASPRRRLGPSWRRLMSEMERRVKGEGWSSLLQAHRFATAAAGRVSLPSSVPFNSPSGHLSHLLWPPCWPAGRAWR